MFVKAIQEVNNFTKPILFASRLLPSTVVAGSATLFFVNENGVALTCRHVADQIKAGVELNQKYAAYREAKSKLKPGHHKQLTALNKQFGFQNNVIVEQLFTFPYLQESECNIDVIPHESLDLAILKFRGLKKPLYQSHAVFVKDLEKIQPGKILCRTGFPFPEFNNFKYNADIDSIEWDLTGSAYTSSFPLEGMITRFYAEKSGKITNIELSSPGLRGQSGGPLFDENGLVYGIQSATLHHHLDFSSAKSVMKNGKQTVVQSHDFLNVGLCVHVDVIKEFLRKNNVKFYEESTQSESMAA